MRYANWISIFVFGIFLFGCKRQFKNGACVNNLRQIESAKAEWAYAHGKDSNSIPEWNDLTAYMYVKDGFPKCPAGGTYTIGPIGELPHCSMMPHNICFGMFSIYNESNDPMVGVRIAVMINVKELCSCETDAKGEANISLKQQLTPDLWSHGTEFVDVEKAGYGTVRIPLPTLNWPIKLQLHQLTNNIN